MTIYAHIIKVQNRAILWLAALLLIAVFVGVWFALQPEGRLNCDSFGSYREVLGAFDNGSRYLDWNHNGIPCEERLFATW